MNNVEFTKKYYVNRKNTDSIKWDNKEVKSKLPMFIADTDFKVNDEIIKALENKIKFGSYGYSVLPKDYYETVIKWNKSQNDITFKKEWIRFSCGAIDGIYQLIFTFTKINDSILITNPVYHPFANTIKTTKRNLVKSPLKVINDKYTFDLIDIEKKIIRNNVKMMILCSPHNPLGRVWNKKELEGLFKITHKHKVLVISDEVHSDLIMPGAKFIPSLSIKNTQNDIITLTAASKTFSFALFQHCHVVIPNKNLRDKFDEYQQTHHLNNVNVNNAYPTYYGYKYGKKWLSSFISVIYENYNYLYSRLSKYVDILPLEGTYLAFVNFKKYTKNAYKFLYEKCNIVPNAGELFDENYPTWARINLATSLDNVKLACNRIEKQLKK